MADLSGAGSNPRAVSRSTVKVSEEGERERENVLSAAGVGERNVIYAAGEQALVQAGCPCLTRALTPPAVSQGVCCRCGVDTEVISLWRGLEEQSLGAGAVSPLQHWAVQVYGDGCCSLDLPHWPLPAGANPLGIPVAATDLISEKSEVFMEPFQWSCLHPQLPDATASPAPSWVEGD